MVVAGARCGFNEFVVSQCSDVVSAASAWWSTLDPAQPDVTAALGDDVIVT